MVNDSELPISLLDIIIIGIFLNAQDLIVILSLALLELELCITDVLRYGGVFW